MAIQFYCPYCTAAIKVPDAAAGRKGRCPKCETEVLVPRVQPPAGRSPRTRGTASAAPAAPETDPPVPAVESHPGAGPVPSDPELRARGELPSTLPGPAMPGISPPQAVPVHPADAAPRSQEDAPFAGAPIVTERPAPVSARIRRRQRRSAGRWLIPLICAAALGGVIAWLIQREQPRLEGELQAEVISDFEIPPQLVPAALIAVDANARETMLEALAEDPERLISPGVIAVEFRGSDEGLLVGVEPTPASEVVRVRIGADPELVRFRKEHSAELLRVRRGDLSEAARDFCLDWLRAAEAGIPLEAGTYLVRLGLTATVVSLGYHVQAVAGQKIYPCAYEDATGSLYFILPSGTSGFRLEGRQLADGRMLFPGNYVVRIGR